MKRVKLPFIRHPSGESTGPIACEAGAECIYLPHSASPQQYRQLLSRHGGEYPESVGMKTKAGQSPLPQGGSPHSVIAAAVRNLDSGFFET